MERLASMTNYNLELDYELVKIRYGDLRDRVMWNLDGVVLGSFDTLSPESAANEYNENAKRKKYEGDFYRKARYGLELAYFVVSETDEGNWNLIDGFRRLFGHSEFDKFLDQEVFVKVYRNVGVFEWTKLIYESNAWKIGIPVEVDFFDRGYRLSMYQHFGFHFEDSTSDLRDSEKLLKDYGSILSRNNILHQYSASLFGNRYYISDIRLLNELLGEKVVFRKKGRGGCDEVTHIFNVDHFERFPFTLFALTLGTIRYENRYDKMNEITIVDVMDLFNEESLSKKFHKLVGMKVIGSALNYIEKDVYEEFKQKVEKVVLLKEGI